MTRSAPPLPRRGGGSGWGAALAALLAGTAPAWAQTAPFTLSGDAIEAPLTALPGDPTRGAALLRNRDTANCLICHAIPDDREPFMGDVGPPLAGVGTRLSAGQLRLRIVDPTRVNPASVMPAYHRTEGLTRVDPRWRGRPVLTAQEVEDLVAFLATLKE